MARTPKYVSVVLRGANAFLVACAGGPGIRWGVEPVYLAEAVEGSLADALAIAILNAPTEFLGMPNLRNYRDPMLEAMQLKSVYSFEKGSKHFALTVDSSMTKLERLVPIPKSRSGLTADADWTKTLPANVDVAEVARIIIEAARTPPER